MGAPRILAPTTISGGIPTAGAGTLNTVALWTPDGFTLGNSLLTQAGSVITNATGAIRANGTTQSTPAFMRYDATTSGIYFPAMNEIGFTISSQHAMFISSGRNVGIGTVNPGSPLQIGSGTQAGSALTTGVRVLTASPWFVASDGTRTTFMGTDGSNAIMGVLTNHPLLIRTNNTLAIAVDATQKVGIGTPSPTATSTIYKANNSLGAWNAQDLSVDGLSNGDAVYQRWYATGIAGAVGRFGVTFQSSVASFVWNSLFNSGVQTAELMRLTGGGNLGIGTATPGAKLHVNGATWVTGGSFYCDTIVPYTGGVTPLNIANLIYARTDTGNVGIGTASPLAQFTLGGVANSTTKMGFQSVSTEVGSITMNSASGEQRITAGFATWGGFQTFYTNGFERARIDSTGNFGIGETSPASYGRLAVTGSAVGAGILGMNTDATRVDIQSYNKPLAINRAGNNTLMNEGGGNVGIGTASPNKKFQVLDSASGEVRFTTTANVVGNTITQRFSSNAGAGAYEGGGAYIQAIQGSGIDVWSLAFGTANLSATAQERARIDSSGNVGIGTASPSSLGTNYTTLDIRGSAGGGIRMGTPSIMSYMYADSSGYNLATSTALPIILYTNNAERARIDSSGNFGIGTASPISPLHVKGNATNTDGILTLTPNTGGRNHQVQSLQASSLFRIYDQSAGVSRLEIDINGNISAATTGGTFNASTSGAGLKLPATPGNADTQTLDCYLDGGASGGATWAPVDNSGAGLTFTVTSARYMRIGRLVLASFDITFPATASGAQAKISLPVTAQAVWQGASIGFGPNVPGLSAAVNNADLNFWTYGAATTNAALSGARLIVSMSYFAN